MTDGQDQHDAGGTGTAAPPRRRPQRTPPRADKLPPYHVLLHNDDVNDILDVVEAVVELTPHPRPRAVELTLTAHRRGVVLLLTTHKERAELYRDQFKAKRLTVTIEPAPGD